jgi:hypothetical protein
VIEALRVDTFLITPHPKVRGYEQFKAKDRDAWLAGVRRATASLEE